MKKNSFVFGIIFIVVILLIIILIYNNISHNPGELIELNYDNVLEKVDNDDDFILVVSQSTCSHCATYKPKLVNIAKEHELDIYYINIDLENKNDRNEFLDSFKLSGSTPTTIFIKDGKEASVLNRIEGDLSEKRVIEKFKKMGFIEE